MLSSGIASEDDRIRAGVLEQWFGAFLAREEWAARAPVAPLEVPLTVDLRPTIEDWWRVLATADFGDDAGIANDVLGAVWAFLMIAWPTTTRAIRGSLRGVAVVPAATIAEGSQP